MPHQILFVDDEPDLELLVTQKLRRHIREKRFEFFFGHNGEEALKILANHPGISLVLSDINMPVMDGLTLLSRLGDTGGTRKAVIVSAYGDMANIRIAMNRGASDFLMKPIDFVDLETTVNKMLTEVEVLKEAAENQEKLQQVEEELNAVARTVLLSEIGKQITASLDLDTILLRLYECVKQIVDTSIFEVGLYRPQKNLIEYSLVMENGRRSAPYTRDTQDTNQFAVWCIENRKPVLIGDMAAEYGNFIPEYEQGKRLLEDGSAAPPRVSMIHLPLIAQDRVLGVLSIQSFHRAAPQTARKPCRLRYHRARQRQRLPAAGRNAARGFRTGSRTGHYQPHHPGALRPTGQYSPDQTGGRSGARPFSGADHLCLAARSHHDDAAFPIYVWRRRRVPAVWRRVDFGDHPHW